jgi:hypothetical protein
MPNPELAAPNSPINVAPTEIHRVIKKIAIVIAGKPKRNTKIIRVISKNPLRLRSNEKRKLSGPPITAIEIMITAIRAREYM